jgi:hypothetical protein
LDTNDKPYVTPRCHVFITDGVIHFLSDCTHSLAGQQVPMVEWRGYEDSDYRALATQFVPHWESAKTPKAEGVETLIPKSQRDAWRALRGQGITSDVGEYTPTEFWTLLDAYEQLLAASNTNPDLQPTATIKCWIDAYTNPSNGPHFQGHGKMVEMLREYLALRLSLANAAGREVTDDVVWVVRDRASRRWRFTVDTEAEARHYAWPEDEVVKFSALAAERGREGTERCAVCGELTAAKGTRRCEAHTVIGGPCSALARDGGPDAE